MGRQPSGLRAGSQTCSLLTLATVFTGAPFHAGISRRVILATILAAFALFQNRLNRLYDIGRNLAFFHTDAPLMRDGPLPWKSRSGSKVPLRFTVPLYIVAPRQFSTQLRSTAAGL